MQGGCAKRLAREKLRVLEGGAAAFAFARAPFQYH